MRLTLDHLGLAVPTLVQGRTCMSRMLPLQQWSEPLAYPNLGVQIQFGWDASGIAFELLAPLGDDSPVAAALRAGRNTLQHVAYRTPTSARLATRSPRGVAAARPCPPRPRIRPCQGDVLFDAAPLRLRVDRSLRGRRLGAPEHAMIDTLAQQIEAVRPANKFA